MAAPEPVARGGLSAASSAPAIDFEAAFVEVSSGRYRLAAPLTFATVPGLFAPGLRRIAAATTELEFDLQGVAASDSAGLALLIDWLAEARARQRTLRYRQAPDALLALARLSEVEALIAPPAASATTGVDRTP
jgi:phospholipid transport system transporter-binding protein